ncbi:MAG: sulfite exporter TauE/SafE family protein [Candidatus Kapaibacterium sp.]|nr:sulfite exporter TauE/SafE family protein [Ignavibacteriota bacterium]MCB9220186.1 sulfite exporter TauE/SafE family protein [Ignavibacteria bacterium]
MFEYQLTDYLLLFLFGNFAGFINVVAGGGSTLTLPFLILMGLDTSVANGTNRIGILTQTMAASLSFRKSKFKDTNLSIKLALLTVPGAILGAIYSTQINEESFQLIVVGVMIFVAVSLFVPKSKTKEYVDTIKKLPLISYPLMLLLGFYAGFIQVGIGFLIMAILGAVLRLNIKRVNMHKVFIVFINTIPTLIIFILTDNVDWVTGIILSIGASLGAWWSAKLSLKMDEKFVKLILFIAIVAMAIKLITKMELF